MKLFWLCPVGCLSLAGLSSLGVPGVPWHTQILEDQFKQGGTDYAHLITTGTPGFSDFPTALYTIIICQQIMIKTQWHKRVITRMVESDFTILPSVWIWRAWFWIFQNVAFCTTDPLLWYRSCIKTNCFIIFVWVSDQAKVSSTVHFANTSENPLNFKKNIP